MIIIFAYIYYCPRSEASEGCVFTGICLSNSGGGWSGQHLPPPALDNTSPPLPWTTPPFHPWPGSKVTTPPSHPQTTPPSPTPPDNTSLPHPPDNTSLPPGQHLPPSPGQGQRSQHLPSPWTTPPSPRTMRRRAVRILLECVLIINIRIKNCHTGLFNTKIQCNFKLLLKRNSHMQQLL